MSKIRLLYLGRNQVLGVGIRDILRQQLPLSLTESLTDIPNKPIQAAPNEQIDSIDFLLVVNQKKVLPAIRQQPPDIFLLEIGNQVASREQFCKRIRKRYPTLPIVAVGMAKPPSQADFDGFIPRPIASQQAMKTIIGLLQRRATQLLTCGAIRLNLANHLLISPKGQYRMPPKQFELLQLLMQKQGQVVTRGEIMQMIWNTSYLEDTRTLDVHIRWLRERIEIEPSNPRYLRTVRGIGYRFCEDDTDSNAEI